MCDLLEKEGQETVKEIEAKHGQDRAFFHQLDVSKEAQGETEAISCVACRNDVYVGWTVTALVKVVVDKWGTVDVLVNNAAAFVFGTIEEASSDDWDRVLTTNVKVSVADVVASLMNALMCLLHE